MPLAAPDWLHRNAPASPPAPRRITPSQFDPDDEAVAPYLRPAAPGIDPRARGDLVHRLLQHLPRIEAGKRAEAAAHFLQQFAPDFSEAERERIAAEALRVLGDPRLAELFGPNSRGEVDILANRIGGETVEIVGRVDRLAVMDKDVIIADFKTGRPPADGAEPPGNYLRQLGVYRSVLAGIYPGRAMRCLLVWTETAAIQEVAADRLETASRGLFTST
jgi:ATP-dependent helicase/nuclease subunit A